MRSTVATFLGEPVTGVIVPGREFQTFDPGFDHLGYKVVSSKFAVKPTVDYKGGVAGEGCHEGL